uniref:Oligopeptide transporter 9 n=1 Tax=Phanerodontia chrysosporium TaxID=2822231 RepID=M9P8W6_PHACH|nr:oligopeptide transporter 9 [Phanerodontia chrysosporium]
MAPEADAAALRMDTLGSMDTATTTDDKEHMDSPSTYSDKAPSIDVHELEGSYPPRSAAPSASPSVSDFFDPNLDVDASWFEDDSPYPEVRSAVANYDDPDIPVNTLRAWILGILWAIVLPGVNQFFYFRYPTIAVGQVVPILVTFPIGRALARMIPEWTVFGLHLNPGPFTIKEHVLVTVMAGVGAVSAYATEIIAVQRVYYNQNFSFLYQWMLVMSTQLIGFSIGGLARRLLVAPASMIWPNTLVLCALYNTLHCASIAGIGPREGISRERFFTYAFLAATLWYFIPGYLFRALSVFTWACWIAPTNVKINLLFGYNSGIGYSILSFDWNEIAYIGSPLVTPWWAQANVFAGFLFFYWFLTPVLYFANVWYSQYMPISSSGAFDNTGQPYNLQRILYSNATFNEDAYEAYSPLYLSTTFALSYGLSFASITATIVHAVLYFRKPIRYHLSRSLSEQPDIHAQLMSRYPQVPEWWYGCIFAVTFVFACVCVEIWPTRMPIWALIVALLIALVYVVPIGMIQAVTNRQVGLNVITELIIGYMLPGRPVAMMMFKTWGYITMSQAMVFTSDLKLGHYMKIPPRAMFICQVVATVIAGTTQLGVMSWMFSNIPDLCHAQQADLSGFTCANAEVFATASVVWGVIGPSRIFSQGIYYPLLFFFLLGAFLPLVVWLMTKRYPDTFLNYVNFPLMFAGIGLVPPATAVNYIPWAIFGFIFQYILRRRYFSLWAKYNYVLSAALDAGTAVGVLLVYFCLQYPLNGRIGENSINRWWGNTIFMKTTDWNGTALRQLAPGETFGPKAW